MDQAADALLIGLALAGDLLRGLPLAINFPLTREQGKHGEALVLGNQVQMLGLWGRLDDASLSGHWGVGG